MSATRNAESLANQGEFRSRVPPSEPLTTTGHKPGVKVGNDAVPEFHMEKHAPGTAPRENTFQPRPECDTPIPARTDAKSEHLVNPTDTLGGTTSQALHGDLYGDHIGRRKKERAGLEGTGAIVGDSLRQIGGDLPKGVDESMGGKGSAQYPSASERIPASAEEVAAERKVPQRAYDYTQS
ncbi:hypothetical protein F4806DRAFT_497993 [Annulohypoxylon nitens]|nr:hypothetical protein F4806DRAFT_497993 [Annulohypoxylon nitens]